MIRQLTQYDYQGWLMFAHEVEPLFGSMVDNIDFQNSIKNCIEFGNAFGIEHSTGELAGIIAINRQEGEIAWLAVGKKFRGNAYGNLLIQKAIKEMNTHKIISVQTFAETIKEGLVARNIYINNGFRDFKNAGLNPAGFETVIMVRNNY